MPYRPDPDDILTIDATPYRVAEHPSAPGIAYGQEGRQGIVYQLHAADGQRAALKLFKARYRLPALVAQAQAITPFAAIPGLEVCARTVLSPLRYGDLARQHPDLSYAVIMPWVSGPTWLDVVLERRALTPAQSLAVARALALLLATMEEQQIAHCDLSAPNLLLPGLLEPPSSQPVALVDVEQIYAPGLNRPDALPGGSAGYAHRTAPAGLWSAVSDRFAGAILLAEILGWGIPEVRAVAGEESYFEPEELQQPGARYATLIRQLDMVWGVAISGLLERSWRSDTLADCPTFGEWLVALPDAPIEVVHAPGLSTIGSSPASESLKTLLSLANNLRAEQNIVGALTVYRHALTLLPETDGLATELCLIIADLEGSERQVLSEVGSGSIATESVAFRPETALPNSAGFTAEMQRRIAADSRPHRRVIWPIVALLLAFLSTGSVIFAYQDRERRSLLMAQTEVAVQGRMTERAWQTEAARAEARAAALTSIAMQTVAAERTVERVIMLEQTANANATQASIATADAAATAIAQTETTEAVLATAAAQATAEAVQSTVEAEVVRATAAAGERVTTIAVQQATARAQELAQRPLDLSGEWYIYNRRPERNGAYLYFFISNNSIVDFSLSPYAEQSGELRYNCGVRFTDINMPIIDNRFAFEGTSADGRTVRANLQFLDDRTVNASVSLTATNIDGICHYNFETTFNRVTNMK